MRMRGLKNRHPDYDYLNRHYYNAYNVERLIAVSLRLHQQLCQVCLQIGNETLYLYQQTSCRLPVIRQFQTPILVGIFH